MTKILYIFISCQKNLVNVKEKINKMMNKLNYNDYFIGVGGYSYNKIYKNHIIKLKCNDFYEGLSEKVLTIFKVLYNSKLYKKYDYICKLDEDMKIINHLINVNDKYIGYVHKHPSGSRNWHFNKFNNKNHKYYNKLYTGNFVPWCLGGLGYYIHTSILYIFKKEILDENEIYEDVYISKILYKNKIYPSHIKNLRSFIVSPEH